LEKVGKIIAYLPATRDAGMKLYEYKELTGARTVLTSEEFFGHHPDAAGWWNATGVVVIEHRDETYKGANGAEIPDAIELDGAFIWTATSTV